MLHFFSDFVSGPLNIDYEFPHVPNKLRNYLYPKKDVYHKNGKSNLTPTDILHTFKLRNPK